jgi:hypothetical protein
MVCAWAAELRVTSAVAVRKRLANLGFMTGWRGWISNALGCAGEDWKGG